MTVPIANLRLSIEATRADWQRNLDRLFAANHFILGEQVRAFEQEFSRFLGARDSIGVATGTDALEICLRVAGVTHPDQEVLASPLTAPFTGLAVLRAGASIRFADVDPATLLLDPASAGEQATARTAAILPVHLYGQACDLPRFRQLARRLGAALVQDACQAHGATWDGKPFTKFSPYVAYSFYPTKNLGALGDGGAIATGAAKVAAAVRLLRDGGRRRGHVSEVAGVNSRLDEMQACYLRAFLPRLDEWNACRARTAALYDEALGDCPDLRTLQRPHGGVYHLYVIRAAHRGRLREFLHARGIGTGIHYSAPLHLQKAFRAAGLKRGALPHAERACREVLSLPLWPYLPEASAGKVAAAIREFYGA
jgi:dTDP-3-amino-3,4,6-trideoxy-alpha-D-glucose transaminase